MSLPIQLRSARMTNSTLGSAIDDNVGQLEKDLADLLGAPIDTDLNVALFEIVAAGLKTIKLADAAADPTAIGNIRRNGSQLLWHNGERAVELQPAGEIKWMAGTGTPTGFLACDGAAYSRTTYARLFARIGTTHGVGDGSTTFNVPNLKGRVLVGQDAGQTEFDTLGELGGEKTHVLTEVEMPLHNHAVSDPGHAHAYTYIHLEAPGGVARFGPDLQNYSTVGGTDAALTGITVGNRGANGAHNNLQPYAVALPYIST